MVNYNDRIRMAKEYARAIQESGRSKDYSIRVAARAYGVKAEEVKDEQQTKRSSW